MNNRPHPIFKTEGQIIELKNPVFRLTYTFIIQVYNFDIVVGKRNGISNLRVAICSRHIHLDLIVFDNIGEKDSGIQHLTTSITKVLLSCAIEMLILDTIV